MTATHMKARRCFLIGRSMRSYLDGAARSWYVSGIVLRPQLIGPTDTCACADCRFMKKNTLEKLRDALVHGYSDFDWLFAFGQVRRPHRLTSVELVFQRDDFGSDVTTGGRGFLESVIGGESGYHVRMSGHEDPQADPRDLRSWCLSMRAIVFIRLAVLPAL
jgi:hypothetical protein